MVADDQHDAVRVPTESVHRENLVPCASCSLDTKLEYVLQLYRDWDRSYRRRRRRCCCENRLILDLDRVENYLLIVAVLHYRHSIDQMHVEDRIDQYARVHLQDARRNHLENLIIIDRQWERTTKTRVRICW